MRSLKMSLLGLSVAALAACGGGGSSGIGSGVMSVSIQSVPTGLEAGRIIPITATITSNNGLLRDGTLSWSLSPTTGLINNVAPVLSNAQCEVVSKQDNAVGNGSSTWTCTANLLVPTTLTQATTFNLRFSGSNQNSYSEQGSIDVTVNPTPNPFQLQTVLQNTTPVVRSGDLVTLQCQANGGRPFITFNTTGTGLTNANYVYQWAVADAQGLLIDLTSTGQGQALVNTTFVETSFTAPVVTQPTTVTIACRTTDNITNIAVQQNGTTTISYLGNSPFQNIEFGSNGALFTIPGSVFSVSNATTQITINP